MTCSALRLLFLQPKALSSVLLHAILLLSGCVTTQQYEALQTQLDEAEKENSELRLARQDAQVSSRELEGQVARLTAENDALAEDANQLGTEAMRLREEVGRLTELNDALTNQSSGRLSDIAEENRQLLEDVMRIREELQTREDRLNALEKDLNEKSALLEARSKRVEELESLLAARERAAEALRARLAEALLGFQGKGLNVEQRNGKVYVSMEAKLLFPSGSASVDPRGREALVGLASVIAEQSDLEIVVEGHTDTDQVAQHEHSSRQLGTQRPACHGRGEHSARRCGSGPLHVVCFRAERIPPCGRR